MTCDPQTHLFFYLSQQIPILATLISHVPYQCGVNHRLSPAAFKMPFSPLFSPPLLSPHRLLCRIYCVPCPCEVEAANHEKWGPDFRPPMQKERRHPTRPASPQADFSARTEEEEEEEVLHMVETFPSLANGPKKKKKENRTFFSRSRDTTASTR